MSQFKVIRAIPLDGNSVLLDEPFNAVPHADYRALEEELAALRTVEGQWEISHRLVCKELESLRGKVSELVEADIALDLAKEKFTYAKGARERRQAALEALK